MGKTLFGWIHLSDIHVGHGDVEHGWDQRLVMDALRRDIASVKGPARIDAILVTGDVAFSGAGRSPDEYERARDWLFTAADAAKIDRRHVFVVPGNHDVNRNAGGDQKRSIARQLDALRAGKETIDAVLGDRVERALLLQRMEGYLAFSKDFGPFAVTGAPPEPFWVHTIDAEEGLRVRLAGLNTALLAAGDDDQGKLQLGKQQLAHMLLPAPADEGELVVAMSHHPFQEGWLADQRDASGWIKSHAHVHLSGHVHEQEAVAVLPSAGGPFVQVTAGAVHSEKMPAGIPATHGYNFAEVVADAEGRLTLRVWPRRWADKRKCFVLDVENVPDGEQRAERPLRARAAPAKAAPPVRLAKGDPVRVFVSFAPEDDALCRKLGKHLTILKNTGVIQIVDSHAVPAEGGGPADIAALEAAQLVLLLVSDSYLASPYVYDVVMEAARARRQAGAAVVAVLLRPTDLYDRDDNDDFRNRTPTWFEELLRIPRKGGAATAVTSWGNEDEAFAAIAKQLREIIARMKSPT